MIKIYLISLINLLKMCKCNKDTDLDDACSCTNFFIRKDEGQLRVSVKDYEEWFANRNTDNMYFRISNDIQKIYYDNKINALYYKHLNPNIDKLVRIYLIPTY